MSAPAPPTTTSEENVLQSPAPAEVTQNGPRTWERAWSVQEMRTEAGYWSLAGDAGLLLHLQEFSHRLISRTHEIGKEMDGLVHEAQLTGARVNNVINSFIMLANTQFVENRVYDEDMSQQEAPKEDKKWEEQEKSREQREAELIPRVTSALKLGIDVIDKAFEKLEPMAVDSDSEEEDNAYKVEPVLEAKDPYMTRSLPFLIGSPQFLEDDNVGLVEELSEEEQESDHGSISVTEDEEESEESETEYSSEESGDEDKQATRKKQRAQTKSSIDSDESSEEASDEDMFTAKKTKKVHSDDSLYSEEEENEKEEKAGPSGGPRDFTTELAARLGAAVPKHQMGGMESDGGEEDDDGWNEESLDHKSKDSLSSDKPKQPKGTKKKEVERERAGSTAEKGKGKSKRTKHEDKGDDLFGQSEQNDDDDFFGKSGGLFSGSKGLFDDDADNEEGDLFGDIDKPVTKTPRKKPAEKEDASFEDEKEDERPEVKTAVESRPRTRSGKLLPKGAVAVFGASDGSKTKGLFEDNEAEDDLFGGASEKVETVKEKPSTTKAPAASGLFDDDEGEDDLFGSMTASVSRQKSHSSVGLTVEGYDEEKVKEQKLEEDRQKKKTPEKKLPPGAVSMFGSGPNPFVAALKKQQEAASSEDEERDNWSDDNSQTSATTSTTSAAKTKVEAKNVGSGIFAGVAGDDDDDGAGDLFASKSRSDSRPDKAGKNLIGNNLRNNLPETDKKKTDKSRPVKDSLFDNTDDEEDNDFFPAPAKSVDRKKSAAVPALGDGDVVVAEKTKTTSNVKPTSQSADKKKANSSLFDDDEEEEGGEPLFSSKPSQPQARKDSVKNKTRDLFDDDDLLFSSEQNESPSVDLFSQQSPLTQPSQDKLTTKPSTSAPPKKAATPSRSTTATLFGGAVDDEEYDDLFSSGHITNSSSGITTSKVISGFAETESSDTMETKEEDEVKPEVKKSKKPAGAISMFGGLDPSAILIKRRPTSISEEEKDKDEKEAKKEENETGVQEEKSQENPPVPKAKPAADLFGIDDDDNEDLFSPKVETGTKVEGATADESVSTPDKVKEITSEESTDTPEREETVALKPESTKPRKPAGAVSMFGGLDPSVFLKKRKVEDPEEKEDDRKDKEVPTSPEPAPKTAPKPKVLPKLDVSTKPKPPTDLFGEADEDDVFNVPSKKVPPPTAPKSPVATSAEVPKLEVESQSPEPLRPKKPAGAVSMFGGVDLFAGMKKKSVSLEEEEKGSSPPRDEPKSPTFNPATLSPGAVHPSLGKSLERSDSVDFDQPAEAEVLATAIKDRPKLNRRRPQSRKARMLAATHTGISFEDVTPTTPTTPTIPEVPDVQDLPALETVTSSKSATQGSSDKNQTSDKSKSKSTDLFGNDDMLDGPPLSSGKPLTGEDKKPGGDDVFGKDLFGGKSAKSSSKAGTDLFSDSSKGDASRSSVKSKTSDSKSAVGKASKKDEIEDDLFAKPTGKSKPNDVSTVLDNDDLHSPLPVTTRHKARATNLDDDLFTSSSVKSSAAKDDRANLESDAKKDDPNSAGKSKADATTKSQVTAVSQDDDIFDDPGLDKQKDKNKKSGTRNSVAKKDDLTRSKNADESKKGRPKKAVTKEGNLLSDTTDIFSDIPEAAPKEPKKKVTKKPTEKKTIFKDDVDDIFADTSAAAVKSKRDAKKRVTKSAAVESDNIFDDPLS